jgi:phosphoribosyl-AMP cyclohydrolase
MKSVSGLFIVCRACSTARGRGGRADLLPYADFWVPRPASGKEDAMSTEFETLDFAKLTGLIPAVIQDADSSEVLMVGFMNRQALAFTLQRGYVTFYSRTRNGLWTKGETSGNRLRVVSAQTDCDRDTLLLRVDVEGAGLVCHRGTRSCFTEDVPIRTENPAMLSARESR